MTQEDMTSWFMRKMVRKYRTLSGKSQREVGEDIDRSANSVRDYESGKTSIPTMSLTDLADSIGMPDDVTAYMKKLGRARRRGEPIEADMRFNALYLSLGEQYAGEIFKWDSVFIPGPLQTEAYHFGPVRKAEPGTDEKVNSGWDFKSERREALRDRTDRPKVHYLIGEAAFFMLSKEPRELQIDQLDFLTACDRIPGWQIRVFTEPWDRGNSNFEIYKPGESPDAGPPFVYTEVYDSSWCIQEPRRVAGYDKWRRIRWPRSIRFKEYRDVFWRDRLA